MDEGHMVFEKVYVRLEPESVSYLSICCSENLADAALLAMKCWAFFQFTQFIQAVLREPLLISPSPKIHKYFTKLVWFMVFIMENYLKYLYSVCVCVHVSVCGIRIQNTYKMNNIPDIRRMQIINGLEMYFRVLYF